MTNLNENTKACLISVGTAVPPKKFTQLEIAKLLEIKDEKSLRFFTHEHIKTRHLCDFDKNLETNNAELIEKFKKNAVEISMQAALKALNRAQVSISNIDYICCVTSTGFIVPTLSLLLSEAMGLKPNCRRADLVGMGCSAGLNGLETVSNWCESNIGKSALLVCCEISSASYVNEAGEANALVNSLFGDGAAACVVKAEKTEALVPLIKKFASYRIENSMNYLRFDWNSDKNLNQFFISKETPVKMGQNISHALKEILSPQESLEQINHWILHTGGAAILSQIVNALKIDESKILNTLEILKNYGNLSSPSFLFSYERLLEQKTIKSGDRGIMITMGPGLVIEMASLQW